MRGLLVGRFQPFHSGHVAVVRHLKQERPLEPLVLGIGSAEEAYTADNPFTAAERYEMISRSLEEAHVTGWLAIPIPDIHRHSLWVAHLEELLPPFGRVYTNNPLTKSLFERAEYPVESTPMFERERFEGTAIRRMIRDDTPGWRDRVPPAAVAYLDDLRATERLKGLAPARTG